MLTVGVDTYIAIDEVGYYAADSKFYQTFLALTDEEKECLLCKAAMKIDLLPLTGRKKSVFQTMAFPRDHQTEVPENVKAAQAEEALAGLDSEMIKRRELQIQWGLSVSLGQVSESYGDVAAAGSMSGLYSSEAYLLLRPYIAGSAVIV